MKIIRQPTQVQAAGSPPKSIEEFIGRVNSATDELSIARMRSPQGWTEPGQRPEFNEYTLVLRGTLVVETEQGRQEIRENEAILMERGEWVRYSSPYEGGAEYIAVCVPAFTPARVHRE